MFLPTDGSAHPTRSIHRGRHRVSVSENLENQMDTVVEFGKANGWTQEQCRAALDKSVADERALLRSGQRALNKNSRTGAN